MIRGPNAHRVTLVTDTRYAVGLQTGRLRMVMAGFAAGSMVLFLFRKQFAQSANCLRKKVESSALPETTGAATSGTT